MGRSGPRTQMGAAASLNAVEIKHRRGDIMSDADILFEVVCLLARAATKPVTGFAT